MNGSAQATPTTRALRWVQQRRATGKLSVGAGADELMVFVLDGAVLAARSGEETRALLARLARVGALPTPRARQLQAMLEHTTQDGARSSHDPIVALLADEVTEPQFEAVRRDRFHEVLCRFVGHLTTPTFEEGAAPWTDSVWIDADPERVSRAVLDWDLASALDERRPVVAGHVGPESAADVAARQVAQRGRVTVSDILASLDLEPIAAKVAVLRMIDRGVLADPPATGARRSGAGWETRPEPPSGPPRAPFVTSDDDLEAFSGEMDLRRGGSAGRFTAEREALDRIELLDLPREAPPTDPTFSPPALSDRDAAQKIEVANDVLVNLCRALDAASGSGRGAATLQLLVDARPRHFAAVLADAKLSANGMLPARVLLGNVRSRAPAEQRRLLNDCLLDLLERAVDKAGDELDEDAYGQVLERIMGYRQRMGL